MYESQNLRGEIEKISTFLGKELHENQLKLLLQHLHFDAFSKNQSVNWESGKKAGILNNTNDLNFIRKGKLKTLRVRMHGITQVLPQVKRVIGKTT